MAVCVADYATANRGLMSVKVNNAGRSYDVLENWVFRIFSSEKWTG